MPKLNHRPTFTNLDSSKSLHAFADGDLIATGIILDHGYGADRFVTLTRRQKDYIESTLCVIINGLCDQLQKLTNLK